MDVVGRLILRFLLVPLGALVAVLAAVATLIIAHWSTMLALAGFYQRQQGDVLAGPLLLFGLGLYATFMLALAAIGALIAETFAIRPWIYHALSGGLSAWVGWSATSDMRDEYAFLNDPKIVVAAWDRSRFQLLARGRMERGLLEADVSTHNATCAGDEAMTTIPNAYCSRCGVPMTCNPGDCWCEQVAPLAVPDPQVGCYCVSCLKSVIEVSARLQSTAVSDKSP
jgi:hypothetical protein